MTQMIAAKQTTAVARRPSIFSANLLYLATMVLILLVGSTVQGRSFGWGLLVTELGLILLPALLWLRRGRFSWRETLRLRWPGWAPVVWSLLIGVGLWLLDSWLGAVMSVLLGYNMLPAAGTYPATVGQALLIFVAFSLAAPLGEEILFRGYMQSAYERRGPRTAILAVGLLFALYHLSLLGLPPRLPLAFALGYVVWRSNSLLPGIAMHLANNALASLTLVGIGLWPETFFTLPVGSIPAAAAGLLLALIALWAFRRSTAAPAPSVSPAPIASRGRLARTWPLLLALVIWLGVAGLEVVMGRAPELLAFGQTLELTEAPTTAVTHRYQLQNVAGDAVGEGVCAYQPAGDTLALDCTLENEAFEIRRGNSYWSSDERTVTLEANWTAADMSLVTAELGIDGATSNLTAVATSTDGEVRVAVSGSNVGGSATTVAPPVLLDSFWPWRLSALPFAPGLVQKATLVYPSRWDPDLNANAIAVTETAVVVQGVEPVSTPAGIFQAWRVTVDGNSAWYTVAAPHTLVKYDDGFLTYLLAE